MKSRHWCWFATTVVLAVVLAEAAAQPAFERGPFTIKTRHYRVQTDIDAATAKQVARHMEAIFSHYTKCFASFKTQIGDTYQVRVYKDRDSYVRDVGEEYKHSGGIFIPMRHAVITFKGKKHWETVFSTLYHEGFHQFFANCIGRGPVWINEGLAVLFEGAVWNGKRFEVGDVPPGRIRYLRAAFESGKFMHLRQLVTIDPDQWLANMGKDWADPAKREYTYAWSFVHFLAYGNKGRNKRYLDKYLNALRARMDFQQAFTATFGRNIDKIEQRWIDYINQLQVTPRQVCRSNLYMLAYVMGYNANRFLDAKPDIEAYHDLLVNKRWQGWQARGADGETYTWEDVDAIDKWFYCPCAKSKRKSKRMTYEFEWINGKDKLPDIICTAHKGMIYRAHVERTGNRFRWWVTGEIRTKGKRKRRRR